MLPPVSSLVEAFSGLVDKELFLCSPKGNCVPVSVKVWEASGQVGGVVELLCADTMHAANVVVTEEGEMVVDFTFRQFDESAPTPMVMPLEKWIETVGKALDPSVVPTVREIR